MKNSQVKSWAKKLLLPAIIGCAGLLTSASKGDPFETSKQLEVFTAVLREVQNVYVDPVSAEQAVGSAIEGMLEELDPYTVYYPEDQIEDVRLLQTGEYGGIGCIIQKIEDVVLISDIHPGGPADKAGLFVGDVLLSVDGKPLEGLRVNEVSTLLKGTPATEVKISAKRFDSPELNFVFNRENITKDAVPFYGMRDDGVAYIYLESFTEQAGNEVKKAALELKKLDPNALILDLRGNGGGLLMEAVKIVSLFVSSSDTLVSTRGRGGVVQDVYRTIGRPILPEIPLAVLTDGSSASASEIVAGALQDLDRAVVLGEPSFGKGLVQQIHPLPFGAQMKVTVAKYYTPSGRCIQKVAYDRNDKGKRIQKSDQRTFSTKNGRKVVDGNGIAPDSLLANDFYPEFVAALSAKGLDLKFAARAIGKMPADVNLGNFEIDEAIWTDFTNFLKEEKFTYESISEMRLKELQELADEMDFMEENDLNPVLEAIKARKDNVLLTEESAIREYLSDYLIQRKYSMPGALERGLQQDEVIARAAEILLHPKTMSELLSVTL
ncbi:S41 family peptidase [Schleiferiaceae bacterium]|nr:S41 family peptidase [Schleiferiaceae bacterium]